MTQVLSYTDLCIDFAEPGTSPSAESQEFVCAVVDACFLGASDDDVERMTVSLGTRHFRKEEAHLSFAELMSCAQSLKHFSTSPEYIVIKSFICGKHLFQL